MTIKYDTDGKVDRVAFAPFEDDDAICDALDTANDERRRLREALRLHCVGSGYCYHCEQRSSQDHESHAPGCLAALPEQKA